MRDSGFKALGDSRTQQRAHYLNKDRSVRSLLIWDWDGFNTANGASRRCYKATSIKERWRLNGLTATITNDFQLYKGFMNMNKQREEVMCKGHFLFFSIVNSFCDVLS